MIKKCISDVACRIFVSICFLFDMKLKETDSNNDFPVTLPSYSNLPPTLTVPCPIRTQQIGVTNTYFLQNTVLARTILCH